MASPVIIDGSVRQSRAGPSDLFARMGPAVYRAAADEGVYLSVFLEAQDPSSGYNDGLDAFGRLMQAAGITTRSDMAMGAFASEWGAFDESRQHRSLVPEYILRITREVMHGGSANTRALYASSDDIPGSSLRPYAESSHMLQTTPLAAPIMLNDLVALTTPITGNAYRAVYLTNTAAQSRMVRVAEGTEIPVAKLQTSQNAINLLKYGRGIRATYESLRRTRIDKVAFWLRQLATQNEIDKVSWAINVLVSGDGNSGTSAANWRAKTDLDALATGKTVTLLAWRTFQKKFLPYFAPTHVFGAEGDIVKLELLNIGSGGTAVPTYLYDPTKPPQNKQMLRDGTITGVTADVATDTLVEFDASKALERVVEIGGTIEELERWAETQEQTLYLTEVENFAIMQPGAVKTLTLET
jgi:hypothetical protein